MTKPNIYINPNILSENISLLTNDNSEIVETINAIYKNIHQLVDEEVWKSPEKSIIMNQLIPYLEQTKDSLNNDLNDYVGVLNKALNDYVQDNELLKTDTDNLSA